MPHFVLVTANKKVKAVLATVILSVISTTSVEAEEGTHLRVSNLSIENKSSLSTTEPYVTRMNIETPNGDNVQIKSMCFFWNQDGPYCFDNWQMQKIGGRSVPTIGLTTGRAAEYTLTGYMTYVFNAKSYYTNQLRAKIKVR